MKLRDIEQALRINGCRKLREGAGHTMWGCGCGEHMVAIPRHRNVSPGVVADAIKKLVCLPEGWLP